MTIKTDHGVIYEPYTGANGQIGFKVIKDNGAHTYIYLNPSDHDSEDEPNVFLYIGSSGEPGYDSPECYFTFKPEDFS
jgi:hypothetical protein